MSCKHKCEINVWLDTIIIFMVGIHSNKDFPVSVIYKSPTVFYCIKLTINSLTKEATMNIVSFKNHL